MYKSSVFSVTPFLLKCADRSLRARKKKDDGEKQVEKAHESSGHYLKGVVFLSR